MIESKRISVEEKSLATTVTSALESNLGISVHNTVKLGFFLEKKTFFSHTVCLVTELKPVH